MNKKIKRIIISSLAVLVATGVCIGVAVTNRTKKSVGVSFSSEQQTSNQTETADERCNILFLGFDSEAGLCDVMMLAGINFTDGTATVAQIPRDTYAAYTQASYKKLNGAYTSLGGAEQTAEFLADAFGIQIHHYACIDLKTFGNIVDALGGVDIELPCNMRYSDPEQGLYIDLKKGKTHLDGDTARQFVRFRSGYADGDIGRLDAQKLFMAAMFSQLSESFSLLDTVKVASALDGVETDLDVSDMLSVCAKLLDMESSDIFMLTLPGKEVTATESGASYYVISRDATAEIVGKYFGGDGEFDRSESFLNRRYESFEKIYGEYIDYSVNSVADIIRDGVELNLR